MTAALQYAEIASALQQAERSRAPIPPVREQIGADNVAAAYAIQRLQTAGRLEAGQRLVGRKIGLTSRQVQAQLGVDQPDFGALFANMAYGSGESIGLDQFIGPKVEGEIALIMERDLNEPQATYADLMRAIAYVVPAIEIVDSRIADWSIRLADTIADNASAAAFVLGGCPRKLDGLDLAVAGLDLRVSGQRLSSGMGSDCLGHPLNAALWLVRTLAANGEGLREGDIVLTGALGPVVAISGQAMVEAHISCLGSVSARFEATR